VTEKKLIPESQVWKDFRRDMINDFQFGTICLRFHNGEPVETLPEGTTFKKHRWIKRQKNENII